MQEKLDALSQAVNDDGPVQDSAVHEGLIAAFEHGLTAIASELTHVEQGVSDAIGKAIGGMRNAVAIARGVAGYKPPSDVAHGSQQAVTQSTQKGSKKKG